MGFDTIAAKAVIRFRLTHPDCRLHLIIPCKNQSERWSDRQRSMYDYTLFAADTVRFLSEEYTDNCMRRRNAELAKLSDIVIAYVGRESSGAGQTVRFAKAEGKRVYNLYPTLEKN